jgi:hypothetical protein
MAGYFSEFSLNSPLPPEPMAVSPVPAPDRNSQSTIQELRMTHPPSPEESPVQTRKSTADSVPDPPLETMSRDEIRFLADVASWPLSTTVNRYQRLHLSRRRGNAVRQSLATGGIIEAVPIATRSGQVMLYQLTDHGRSVCESVGIAPGPVPRASLEHQYWVMKVREHFENLGYGVALEHPIPGDGAVDLLGERSGERVAIEIETGKSDIKTNLAKVKNADFDRLVVVATSPPAVSACHRAIEGAGLGNDPSVELMTWLDVG